MIETAVRSEANAEIRARIDAFTDPRELIAFIVAASAAKFEQWSGDAPGDRGRPPGARRTRKPRPSQRHALGRTAQRLADLGALRAGLDVEQATDVLWFFISNASYFTLTDDLAWPLPRATEWLTSTLEQALLSSPAQ